MDLKNRVNVWQNQYSIVKQNKIKVKIKKSSHEKLIKKKKKEKQRYDWTMRETSDLPNKNH